MANEPIVETTTATETTTARPNETSVLGDAKTEEVVEQKAAEQKPAEQKTEEKKAETPAALDIKAIKIPDGFTADEAQLSELATVLNDQTLDPNARAQKLIDLHTSALKKAAEGPSAEWDATTETWVKEMAADKEIGSGNPKAPLKPEVKAALSKIIDQVGGTALRQALDFTGAGNNLAIAKAFYKLGQSVLEGSPVTGNPPTGKRPESGAASLYPDLPPG